MLRGDHALAAVGGRARQHCDDDTLSEFVWHASAASASWAPPSGMYTWVAARSDAARHLLGGARGRHHAVELLVAGIDDPDLRNAAFDVVDPVVLASKFRNLVGVAASTLDAVANGPTTLHGPQMVRSLASQPTGPVVATHPAHAAAIIDARSRFLSTSPNPVETFNESQMLDAASRWLAHRARTVADTMRWWTDDALADPFDVVRATWLVRHGHVDGDSARIDDRLSRHPYFELAEPLRDPASPLSVAANPATPTTEAAELIGDLELWWPQLFSVRPGDIDWVHAVVDAGIRVSKWEPWPHEAAAVAAYLTRPRSDDVRVAERVSRLGRWWDDLDAAVAVCPIQAFTEQDSPTEMSAIAARQLAGAYRGDPGLLEVAAAAIDADPTITVGALCGLLRRL